MSGHSQFKKNKYYQVSCKNYNEDYGLKKIYKIDMTLSGTYLAKYPFKNIKVKKFDKYPSFNEISLLINNIIDKYSINKERYSVILGAGTNGLIQNICKILLNNKSNVVLPFLSFSQVEYAANSLGAQTRRAFLDQLKINIKYIEESIDKNTKIVYICNPNNPTGLLVENSIILKLVNKFPNVYFLIDESNIDFSNNKSLIEEKMPSNLIVLKSFSKAYGISNLRIGYLVCDKAFEEIYKRNVTINEISSVAIYCANKSIKSNNYKCNIEKIKNEINYLKKELNNVKIKTVESFSNTLFTETVFDKDFIKILNKHEIFLVPVFDQDENLHFRIAVQEHRINKLFIRELSNIKNIEKYIK